MGRGSAEMAARRHLVPGEDAPRILLVGLLLMGISSTLGSVRLGADALRAGALSPRPAGGGTTARPLAGPATMAVPASAPVAASTLPAAVADCPPLFLMRFDKNGGTPHFEAAQMEALQRWLADHPETTLVIDGHADSRGSLATNLELSQRRADRAAAAFVAAGLPRRRLTRRAFGSYAPLVGRADSARQNRRVTLSVIGAPAGCATAEVP